MAGVKNQKWSKFKVKRRTIQRNLIAIRNKLNAQAVYKEDKEDVKKLDEALDFLSKIDYNDSTWSYNGVCPICGSDNIIYCPIEPCCFDSRDPKKELGKIIGLVINHCLDCGFTNIENPSPSDDHNSEW